MRDLFIIACIAVAAGAAAYLGIDVIRWATRRTVREPRTEPVSPAATTARPGRLLLPLVRWAQRGGDAAPAPTAPVQPDEPAREESGADEDWGTELRSMTAELKLHPGFTTDEPAEPAYPRLDPEDLKYAAWIEECRSRLAVAEEHAARELARIIEALDPDANATGQWDRAALDEMLEGASA